MQENSGIFEKLKFQVTEKQWEVFLLFLMIGNGILPQIIPGSIVSPFFMGLEFALIPFALLFFSIHRQAKTLLAFAFLGYEYPLILAASLFILALSAKIWRTQKFTITKPLLLYLLLIIYAFTLFIFTSFVFVSFSGLIFWIFTFLGPVILLLYLIQFTYSAEISEGILRFFTRSIVIQFPIILLQAINMRTIIPGDWAGGSMLDAHNCGIFIGLYGLILILPKITLRTKTTSWLNFSFLKRAVPALFFLLITDSKTIYLIVLVSLLLFLLITLIKFIPKKRVQLNRKRISFYFLVGLSSFMLLPVLAQSYIRFALDNPEADIYEVIGNYFQDDDKEFTADFISNQKAVLYKRVFSQMKKEEELLWWVGTGPGSFSSRAANTLAYDVLFKESQKIPSFIPPVSSPWTRKYLSDLMTAELVEIILFHSTFLAAPSSGIVAIKAELGWPGFVLFLLFTVFMAASLIPGKGNEFLQIHSQAIAIFWIMFPLLMIFDNYQEKPVISFPLMILTAVLLKTSNKQS